MKQSEHLSNAQIEQYGKRAPGAEPETEARVDQHLDDCSSCRSRVLDFQRTRFGLLPDPKVNKVSTSDCSSEDDLRNLAAGLYPDPKAAKLKAHAVTCGRCGPLLQEYIEDFSDKSSPEEQAFLSQLRTASPEFREQEAREMFEREILKKNPVIPEPVPATDWRRFFSWKWMMVPALPAVALIAVGIWYLQRDTPEKAENLLVQAQTEQRTIEMRWPGAKWSPYSSGTRGHVDHHSDALERAQEMLSPHSALNDPAWIRATAESEIALGDSHDAIAKLEKIASSNSAPVGVQLDLAMAYFLQGDYERSGQVLADILRQHPENTVAIFNRALVYERLQQYLMAEKEWKLFLNIEPDSDWRNEAEKKLSQVQDMIRSQNR